MRRTVSLLVMTLVFSAAVLTTGAAGAAESTRLSMGAASTGTWIYLFTALLAETWKKSIPGLDITVLATAGTTANYIPMDKGELDLASAVEIHPAGERDALVAAARARALARLAILTFSAG